MLETPIATAVHCRIDTTFIVRRALEPKNLFVHYGLSCEYTNATKKGEWFARLVAGLHKHGMDVGWSRQPRRLPADTVTLDHMATMYDRI